VSSDPSNLEAVEARIWSLLFPRLDDGMARDLEELLARLYARYRADHVAG
jgi:hypothetical protein